MDDGIGRKRVKYCEKKGDSQAHTHSISLTHSHANVKQTEREIHFAYM